MTAVGARVGAILKADEEAVHLLGYGVYDGRFEAPTGPFGMSWEEYDKAQRDHGIEPRRPTNPRITLDDGHVVWGQQCWWGPEDQVKAAIGDRKVIIVDLDGAPLTPAQRRADEEG